MEIYTQIISYPALLYGYYRVKESDGAAGIDGVELEDFEEDLQKNITRLNYQLTSGKYKPLPLLAFEKKTLPEWNTKKTTVPKIRLLTIPAVRDRIVQAAALNILEPIIDAELEDESFAYRKGFSRESAARRINLLFNKGYTWLLDADIRKFFDSVDHDILFTRLGSIVNDGKLLELIKNWIQCEYVFNNKKWRQLTGLPLGLVISPILANLYLDKFDEEIAKRGMHLVRFADDFVILTRSKTEAMDALKLTAELLADVKLELNTEKTKISNFNEGFKYLGYIFLNSLIVPAGEKDTSKPVPFNIDNDALLEIERFKEITAKKKEAKIFEQNLQSTLLGQQLLTAIENKGLTLNDFIKNLKPEPLPADEKTDEVTGIEKEPEGETSKEKEEGEIKTAKEIPYDAYAVSVKRTLYIQTQGSELRKEGERFLVIKGETILIDIPALRINQIIIFGTSTISPAVMQYCLTNKILISLLSSYGKYFGKIENAFNKNIEIEQLQYLSNLDELFSLGIAKCVVEAKINNLRTLLQRVIKRRENEGIKQAVDELKKCLSNIETAKNAEQLRGVEGNASAVYFAVYGNAFLKGSGFFTPNFTRTKRPPLDPINSLLSFGYTLLSANIYSTLAALGLNPYVGFFHTIRHGHPALASDLIEEFRHVIDSLVIQVINKSILTRKQFYFVKDDEMPCLLTNEGRKEYIRQFEIKMHRVTTHTPTGKKADYRRCILFQVQQYIKVLKREKEKYEPMRVKF